jgi:hypothetical protein
MFKLSCRSSAIDLSVLRILFSGYMLLYHSVIKATLSIGSANELFQPIGIFKLLSHPLSNVQLETIYLIWLGLCVLVLLGGLTRIFMPGWLLFSIFVMGYESNFGSVSNSTQLILLASFVLTLSPCADILSVDSLIFKRKERDPWNYYWPKLTIQLLVALSMCTVGLQKLFFQGPEWALSDKLYLTIFVNPVHSQITEWVLNQPLWLTQLLALYVMFIVEILAPLALLRPFNYIYPLIWASLHIGIHLVLGGFILFFSQIAVYLCFYNFNFLVPLGRKIINLLYQTNVLQKEYSQSKKYS